MTSEDETTSAGTKSSWIRPDQTYHAHFDCFSGAAGDMMMAACLDVAGTESSKLLQHVIECLENGLPELKGEFNIETTRVTRGGKGSIAALHVNVKSCYHHAPAPLPGSKTLKNDDKNSRSLSSHHHGGHDNLGENYNHEHEHGHQHQHQHQHQHNNHHHKHEHKHEHEHEHEHGHQHQHQHNHDHKNEHKHEHEHEHEHGKEHKRKREHTVQGASRKVSRGEKELGNDDKTDGKKLDVSQSAALKKSDTNDQDESHSYNHHSHSHSHSHAHSHSHSHSHHHSHGGSSDNSNAPLLRNLPEIRRMLQNSPEAFIDPWVRETSIAAFTELAKAEAYTHGAPSIDMVHFHEVGAVDSLVDTIGTCIALWALGVTSISCSRLPLGEGTVWTDHGLLPVPAPAALRLLVDMPVCPGPPGITGELVTPTAAALLKVLATKPQSTQQQQQPIIKGRPPNFTIRKIGIGAGTKDFENHPNILRLLLGDSITTR